MHFIEQKKNNEGLPAARLPKRGQAPIRTAQAGLFRLPDELLFVRKKKN